MTIITTVASTCDQPARHGCRCQGGATVHEPSAMQTEPRFRFTEASAVRAMLSDPRADLSGAPRRPCRGCRRRVLSVPSSVVGSRSSCWSISRFTRITLLIVSTMCTGMRIVLAWSAMALVMAWRIHHVA